MATFFLGDPHGDFRPLLRAAADGTISAGDTVVLLGDYDVQAPLRDVVAPVTATGATVRWILGNHDVHDCTQYDYVTSWADADLHGRVHVTGSGTAIAGLGGVFKGSLWYPQAGTEAPAHASRAAYVRSLKSQERWRRGIPLRHRDAIWREDVEALSRRRADVLITHEAPTTHRHGFGAIDALAVSLRASWVVHGHHHSDYVGSIGDGIGVKGLGRAELWRLPE